MAVPSSDRALTHPWPFVTICKHNMLLLQVGSIALLKPISQFTDEERRISRFLEKGATCHPFVILALFKINGRLFTLGTTVSSYSSGPANGYLAPWKKNPRRWNRSHFRAFWDSEAPQEWLRRLWLLPGQLFNKKGTNWVNMTRVSLVPISALRRFETPGGSDLCMAPESLVDLRASIAAVSADYRSILDEFQGSAIYRSSVYRTT